MLSRWKRILLGVGIGMGLLVACVLVLTQTLGEHQPLYQGQTYYYWLAQVRSPDSATSNHAVVVFQTDVIPQLTDQMFHDTNDSNLRLSLIDLLNGLPGITIYYAPAGSRRAGAVGQLGPLAKQALPQLVQALKSKDEAVRGPAARALGQLRSDPEKIIPVLMSCLADPQEGVPEGAVAGLGCFGELAHDALPKLRELAKVPDKDLQAEVSMALKKIAPDAEGTNSTAVVNSEHGR